jgi:hypothetical protein
MSFRGKVSDSLLMTALLVFISFFTMFPRSHAYTVAAEPEHYIDVPFYYQENDYYCGPAALEMIFDFWGENISQSEIADVARTVSHITFADEMRRAAHFSNMSTSMGTELIENITGYALRSLGYAAFEMSGMTLDDLKSLIDRKFPIILLMRWVPSEGYGHYRVAVGYNDTCMFLHDPWNTAWGYTEYGGPNIAMNYTFFLDMWDYSGRWGLFASPWIVTVGLPDKIRVGERFEVATKVFYVSPDLFSVDQFPASSCNASIILPDGLTLGQGESSTNALGDMQAGGLTMASWIVDATQAGNYSITIQAEGSINGIVTEKPEAGPSYAYQDTIGGVASISVTVETVSQIYIKGIDPSQGSTGTKARFFGGGATPNGTVAALFAGVINQTVVIGDDSVPIVVFVQENFTVGDTIADPKGFWEIIFTVPSVPIGDYPVYAVDNETSRSDVTHFMLAAQAQIGIRSVSLTSGVPSATVNVNGDGATPYNEVEIYFDGFNVANSTADQGGVWNAFFPLPDLPPGEYIITALDVISNTTDTAIFTLPSPPAIHVSPEEAPIGSKITVTGEGFSPNAGIYITFEDMLFFTPIYTDERGEFNTTIFVPTVTSGNYTIKAVSAYPYPQGFPILVRTNFNVTIGLDTLVQTIENMKTALNQTQESAQTTLNEASSAKEAAQAAEVMASQARSYALVAMIFAAVITALSSIYFTTLYTRIEKHKQREEAT